MDYETWLKHAETVAELKGEVFFWKFMTVAMGIIALALAMWGGLR